MSHGSHLKHMLYGAAAMFLVLLAVGVPVGTALAYGLLLTCPLMMVGMMLSGGGHGDHSAAPGADDHVEAEPHADRAQPSERPR